MTNPFDEFDSKEAGNPFDEFDAPKSKHRQLLDAAANQVLLGPFLGPIANVAGTRYAKARDFGSKVISSIPGDAMEIAVQAAQNPGQVLKGVGDTAAGAAAYLMDPAAAFARTVAPDVARKAYGDSRMRPLEATQPARDALVDGVKEKYGSPDAIYKTATEHPVSMALDALSLVPGPGGPAAISAEAANRARQTAALRGAGVRVSAGQATGSPFLKMAEDVTAKLPGGSVMDPRRGQMERLTQEAARRSGIEAEVLTPGVLNEAFDRIGGNIDTIQGRHPVRVDQSFLDDLAHIDQAAPVTDNPAGVRHFTDRLSAAPHVAPAEAQQIRTALNRAIKGSGQNPSLQAAYIDIKGALDEALQRTIARSGRAEDFTALRAARQQYANLNVLTDALARSGEAGANGVLTPTALAAASKASLGKTSYMRGRGDLHDLAEASFARLQRPPDSGTHTRGSVMEIPRAIASPFMSLGVNSRPAQAVLENARLPSLLEAQGATLAPYQLMKLGLLNGESLE